MQTWLITPRRALLRAVFALFAVLVAGFASAGCGRYDTLVEKDQIAAEKWSNLDASLQRRFDLVPNLVAAVKGSAKHEENTLAAVTEARAQVGRLKLTADDLTDPAKVTAFQNAQANLQSSLSRLLVVQENYPDLKANQAFHDLQVQLEGTENRILRAREEYNGAARDYNAELLKIGGMVVNKVTGHPFKPRVYFTATEGAQVAPKVTF